MILEHVTSSPAPFEGELPGDISISRDLIERMRWLFQIPEWSNNMEVGAGVAFCEFTGDSLTIRTSNLEGDSFEDTFYPILKWLAQYSDPYGNDWDFVGYFCRLNAPTNQPTLIYFKHRKVYFLPVTTEAEEAVEGDLEKYIYE